MIRFYRRFRIAPGVTVNVGKRNASISVGRRGAHVTVGTAGNRATVGLPGTGLYWTEKLGRASFWWLVFLIGLVVVLVLAHLP
jgi:hypothetical protein